MQIGCSIFRRSTRQNKRRNGIPWHLIASRVFPNRTSRHRPRRRAEAPRILRSRRRRRAVVVWNGGSRPRMRVRSRQRAAKLRRVPAKTLRIPAIRLVGPGRVPKTDRRRRAARMHLPLHRTPAARAMRLCRQSLLVRRSQSKVLPQNRQSLRNRISLPQRSAEGRRNCPPQRKVNALRGRNRVRQLPQGLLPRLPRASSLPSAVLRGAASADSARGLRIASAPAAGSP